MICDRACPAIPRQATERQRGSSSNRKFACGEESIGSGEASLVYEALTLSHHGLSDVTGTSTCLCSFFPVFEELE